MSSPRPSRPAADPVVSLISLGCSKNTVDSECLLGELMTHGLRVAEDPAESDVCLVNTCGFIEEARRETEATLARLARLRRRGRPSRIIALGCLVERTAQLDRLAHFLDEADARVSFRDYSRLPEICREIFSKPVAAEPPAASGYRPDFLDFLRQPRARIGRVHSAYLKISEGCSNRCRYCAIPLIRGAQVSRPLEDILAEADQLIRHGAREINLIAQDTTTYGLDRYGQARLPELLKKLGESNPGTWFRLLYAHPAHLSDEVVELLAGAPHLCPYLDLPLQHIADPLLARMGRGITRPRTIRLLERIRKAMPGGALRTTFIVGFPGETDGQFSELVDFVREGWFDFAGVFAYSREPGTPAAAEPDDVPPAEKKRRQAVLLETQRAVSTRRNRARVGSMMEVMLDTLPHRESNERLPGNVWAVGRTRMQAPEVDGVVYLRGPAQRGATPGARLQARITEATDYDLVAEA